MAIHQLFVLAITAPDPQKSRALFFPHLLTYSSNFTRFALKPRWVWDFLQTLHLSIRTIFLAVFANFFCSDLGWLP
jgi:hypothetical protein